MAANAACSAPEAGQAEADVSEARRWNVNDVSILYPLPEPGQGELLLPMRLPTEAGDKVLLPKAVFDMLGDDDASPYPFLFEAPGRDRAYEMLRVTAVRVDPCFESLDPAADEACVHQIRLSAQVMSSPEEASLDDASVHLFYELDDAAFVSFLLALRPLRLREQNEGNEPLGPHPVMRREGLDGRWAQRLHEILLDACDESNLVRMTFMATGRSGNNWFWGVLQRGDHGEFAPGTIPVIEQASDAFTQFGTDDNPDGIPPETTFEHPFFPGALLRGATIDALSDSEFDDAIDALARIQNPRLHSSATLNCAACHLAASTAHLATARRGLEAVPETPSAFDAPTKQNVELVAAELGSRNMHAFSWFGGKPAISPRVVHDSAVSAHYLSSKAFPDSLPAKLRKKWLSPD